jgi:hypothetical protein
MKLFSYNMELFPYYTQAQKKIRCELDEHQATLQKITPYKRYDDTNTLR